MALGSQAHQCCLCKTWSPTTDSNVPKTFCNNVKPWNTAMALGPISADSLNQSMWAGYKYLKIYFACSDSLQPEVTLVWLPGWRIGWTLSYCLCRLGNLKPHSKMASQSVICLSTQALYRSWRLGGETSEQANERLRGWSTDLLQLIQWSASVNC